MNSFTTIPKIIAIVQARVGSTRLPGKVLRPLSGKPMLWHVFNRLSHSKLIHKTVIATTTLPEDNQIELFCKENRILFYRGSSDDVLNRYFECAKKFRTEIIVRITADCPLIDPEIVDKMIKAFLKLNELRIFDYLSNTIHRTFPRGLDIEIFSFRTLLKVNRQAAKEYEREHVTPFIYEHPQMFKIKNFVSEKDYSFHRWTVDTEEDFKLVEEIYKALYNQKKIFLLEDILKLFKNRPELININQQVPQKKLGE